MGLDYMRLAHVSNPEHEAQNAISLANDGVSAEEQCVRPLNWP